MLFPVHQGTLFGEIFNMLMKHVQRELNKVLIKVVFCQSLMDTDNTESYDKLSLASISFNFMLFVSVFCLSPK